MSAPKRPASGEHHGMSKLTDAKVRRMRYVNEGPLRVTWVRLGREFGVRPETARDVCLYRSWGQIK